MASSIAFVMVRPVLISPCDATIIPTGRYGRPVAASHGEFSLLTPNCLSWSPRSGVFGAMANRYGANCAVWPNSDEHRSRGLSGIRPPVPTHGSAQGPLSAHAALGQVGTYGTSCRELG